MVRVGIKYFGAKIVDDRIAEHAHANSLDQAKEGKRVVLTKPVPLGQDLGHQDKPHPIRNSDELVEILFEPFHEMCCKIKRRL